MQNRSNSLIIVVHEIYGINQHMNYICRTLSEKGFDVICPSLYELETSFEYIQEEVAYKHFMENVGFTNASKKIKCVLSDMKDRYEKVYIVGFSVGATIAWLCSDENGVDGIVGFYGSRIRSYIEIEPLCPSLLFFPEIEKSFNVNELIQRLEEKNIKVHKFNGHHGFSDPFSHKYHEKSAQKAFNKMFDFFRKIE
ncbi:dienelactone hydrolase family protein [Psychrobacillus sp. PGGUH221]